MFLRNYGTFPDFDCRSGVVVYGVLGHKKFPIQTNCHFWGNTNWCHRIHQLSWVKSAVLKILSVHTSQFWSLSPFHHLKHNTVKKIYTFHINIEIHKHFDNTLHDTFTIHVHKLMELQPNRRSLCETAFQHLQVRNHWIFSTRNGDTVQPCSLHWVNPNQILRATWSFPKLNQVVFVPKPNQTTLVQFSRDIKLTNHSWRNGKLQHEEINCVEPIPARHIFFPFSTF